jgi:hypothetical protein
VEAGNVLLHFPSLKRLRAFLEYLEDIDTGYYKAINSNKGLSHDIYLPLGGNTFVDMAFSLAEFEELRHMVRSFLQETAAPFPSLTTSLDAAFRACIKLISQD